jgi:hypothetical protein
MNVMISFQRIILHRKTMKSVGFFFMALLMAQCFSIVSVDQPEGAVAGEEITVTLSVEIDPSADLNNQRVVAAILVPKSWNAAAHTTITYTSSRGNGTMSLIPSGQTAPNSTLSWPNEIRTKIGIGDNLIEEVEWVAFWSNEIYNVMDADAVITGAIKITTTAGPQNTISQLGYFIGESSLDLNTTGNYSTAFPDCFQVTNGTGAIIDFCNPQIASVAPLKSLDNDIITVSFDATLAPSSALTGADKVFLCATGYANGVPVEVCGATAKNEMVSVGEDLWRLDLWPRGYFDLSDDQTLDYIEYSFRNAAGDIVVQDPNSGSPLVFEFTCAN